MSEIHIDDGVEYSMDLAASVIVAQGGLPFDLFRAVATKIENENINGYPFEFNGAMVYRLNKITAYDLVNLGFFGKTNKKHDKGMILSFELGSEITNVAISWGEGDHGEYIRGALKSPSEEALTLLRTFICG